MYENNGVVRVVGRGSVETTFSGVKYRAEVQTSGATGPEAKERAKPTIDAILKALGEWAERAQVDMQRLRTRFDVAVAKRYDGTTHVFAGYTATYKISFEGKNVEHATGLHDALTSIPHVQSPSPEFQIETEGVAAKVFEMAVKKAQASFKAQCTALGIDSKDFVLDAWGIHDDDRPQGKTLSAESSGGSGGSFTIEPGKATMHQTVTLAYVRHKLPTAPPTELPHPKGPRA